MNLDTQQAPSGKGKLKVGDHAPDFTLPTQKTGESFHLYDMIGKLAIVLFFYPKDDTPGCTAEACSFRDSYEAFQEAGAEVVGADRAKVLFAAKPHAPSLPVAPGIAHP